VAFGVEIEANGLWWGRVRWTAELEEKVAGRLRRELRDMTLASKGLFKGNAIKIVILG
jgi:hypothetical protein